MSLPFGITVGEISIAGLVSGLLIFAGGYLRNRRQSRIEARRDRVYDWHREMQRLFAQVLSKGRRLKIGDRTGIDLDDVEELIPVASDLDAQIDTPPQGVKKMVDQEVLQDVRRAAILVYEFVHLPAPDQEANSFSGVMCHQYQLLQELDLDTGMKVEDVLELIGEFSEPDEMDISEEEAEQILSQFKEEAGQKLEKPEAMTVDELMQLPWEEVDRVVSAETRRELVQFLIEQYYEKALIEHPRKARDSLAQSQADLFD